MPSSNKIEWLTKTQSGLNPKHVASIQQTIDMALNSGASAADIVLLESENQSLKAQGGKIAENKISASRVIGIRVQKDSRLGISYSESMEESDLRNMVEMALSNAAFTKTDPSQGIHSDPEQNINHGILLPDCSAQYNDEQIELPPKEELVLRLESEPLSRDSRVRVVPYNGFGESRSNSYVANSNGVFGYERAHGYNCYTYVLMEDGGVKSDYGESSIARKFAALDWQNCVTKAVSEAGLLLEAKPIANGNYDVIFTPDAFAALFSCFEVIFSGFAAKTKINPLRDKLGQVIASEKLQVIDMPRYQNSLHMQYFDAEGLIPQDLQLIEDGVLKNFYHNCETAKYFDLKSNARAARSPQGSLGTAGNCLVILPQDTASDIRGGEFLEIMDLHGLHSGCDAISGDFSLPCSGKLYRNGQRIQAVRDITLAGNFYKMLQQIDAVGSELKATNGRGFFMPDLRFSGLMVAG